MPYVTPRSPFIVFFFHARANTDIYTLSLHDALPIWIGGRRDRRQAAPETRGVVLDRDDERDHQSGSVRRSVPRNAGCRDRKSTRLNSSHSQISYAVFCLKKKKSTAR